MQNISRQAIEKLMSTRNGQPSITMYMPVSTSSSPPEINANQIRFKNLMNQSIALATNHGAAKSTAKQLTDILESNLYDEKF